MIVEIEEETKEPFDAVAYFTRMADVPMLMEIKQWIENDLRKPLSDALALDIWLDEIDDGVSEDGLYRKFKFGPDTHFTVRFKDGTSHTKTIYGKEDNPAVAK